MLFFLSILAISFAQNPEGQEKSEDTTTSEKPYDKNTSEDSESQKSNPPQIIIFGEKEVDVLRRQMEKQLYSYGYREGIIRNGKTI